MTQCSSAASQHAASVTMTQLTLELGVSRSFAPCCSVVEADESEEDEEELGGLFRVSRPQTSKRFKANAVDCSRFNPDTSHNWDLEEVGLCLIIIYNNSNDNHSLILCEIKLKTVKRLNVSPRC